MTRTTTRRITQSMLLGVLWYFEVYGTNQAHDLFGQPQPGVVGTVLPATIGPFENRADCERYRTFYETGDVNYPGRVGTLGCRSVGKPDAS